MRLIPLSRPARRLPRATPLATGAVGAKPLDRSRAPAARRADVSDLVVYQVWLPYYKQNADVGQTAADAFANAAAHLADVAALGVNAVQLCPFHPNNGNTLLASPYWVNDYRGVNPALGATVDSVRDYIAAAHAQGLKVIYDAVFHSSGEQNPLTLSHPEWYQHAADGSFVKNAYNFYVFDFTVPALWDYFVQVLKDWASVGFDGLRADVAQSAPLAFWAYLNNELKQDHPGWFQVCESNSQLATYVAPYTGALVPGGRATAWYGFDLGYGVAWMYEEDAVLAGTATNGCADIVTAHNLPQNLTGAVPAGTVLYRGVDNASQDVRAVALGAGNAGMLAAQAVNFLLDGVPFLFNGMEIGDDSVTSVNPQTYIDWTHPAAAGNAAALTAWIALRRSRPEFTRGSTTWLANNHADTLLSFVRSYLDRRTLVIANLSAAPVDAVVTGQAGQHLVGTYTDLVSEATVDAASDQITLTVPADTVVALAAVTESIYERQGPFVGTGTASATATFAAQPAAGNLLLAALTGTTAITNATMPDGWTRLTGATVAISTGAVSLWWKLAGANEPLAVKAQYASSTACHLHISEWCVPGTPAPDQVANTADTGNVTSKASGTTPDTTAAHELAFFAVGLSGAVTGPAWSASYAEGDSALLKTSALVVPATGAQASTLSWTTQRRAGGVVATFKGS